MSAIDRYAAACRYFRRGKMTLKTTQFASSALILHAGTPFLVSQRSSGTAWKSS